MIEHIEQGTLAPNIRACIALTSWKKRINTVGLTIYNLFETCGPDYHIVLTLAEEEFPRKEQELPRDLVLMNKAGVFEILWCKRNYKSFKKWFFCAMRYVNVPIISADDDCVYVYNYAGELYNIWKTHQTAVIAETTDCNIWGYAALYPPNILQNRHDISGIIDECLSLDFSHDDLFMTSYCRSMNISIISLHKPMSSVAAIHSHVETLGEKRAQFRTEGINENYLMYRIFKSHNIEHVPVRPHQII